MRNEIVPGWCDERSVLMLESVDIFLDLHSLDPPAPKVPRHKSLWTERTCESTMVQLEPGVAFSIFAGLQKGQRL